MDTSLSQFKSVASSARLAALRILLSTEEAGVLAEDKVERFIDEVALDARDRALAVHLVHGVERYRATLDWRLSAVSDRAMSRLPLLVQMVLRLGAYQLLYMSKIPSSAAVNESVRLMRTVGKKLGRDWSGFVNAVLRGLTRTAPPPWPDLEREPVQALAVRFSCPRWLAERWLKRLGPAGAEQWCRASLEVPPLTLRINSLQTTRDRFMDQYRQAGISARPTAVSPYGVSVERQQTVQSLPLYQDGAFYVEDEAAQLIPLLLDPQPGERVLDACAAPGGKATHLAALMENKGEIVAIDRSQARLQLIRQNCHRLGITIITPRVGDLLNDDLSSVLGAGSGSDSSSRPAAAPLFDRILLDAPCSGLGILRRHPEGKWHKHAASLAIHHRTQSDLLERVSALLRPGGRLVYSTCSTEPDENEQVIDRFCCAHRDFHREHVGSWLPPAGLPLITSRGDLSTMNNAFAMDGFYAARLRKVT
jgi:16S rRNA (cytosine967-C5)-methyltransferase